MSMESIKELRARTHLGLTECKKALEASQGNVEQAIEWLMKQGLKQADKAVETLEGQVRASVLGSQGRIVEINCQTDFAAKSELFNQFLTDGKFDEENINWLSKQLGEVVKLRRAQVFFSDVNSTKIYAYNHPNGKIAVLLILDISQDIPVSESPDMPLSQVENFAEHVMLQIAAASPRYLNKEELPSEVLDKQKRLFEEQLASEKKPKPQDKWPKIIEGKLNKWMEECVLLEQTSVINNKSKIKDLEKLHPGVIIKKFYRYELGEVV